jgi:osmotically-inducible protein OsmY
MKDKRPRIHLATILGTFVLSTVLVSGTASAQQQQRQQGQQQGQQGQQMTKFHDSQIQDRINLRLARSGSLSGTDIVVDVDNRVATLTGTVGSEQEKERAMRLARRVRGVQEVKSALDIDQQAVEQRRNVEVDDDKLEEQVANKLADETFPLAEVDEGLFGTVEVDGYAWEFEVEADDGVITLEGDVDSYGDINDAVSAARAVPGVKSVNSELRVDYYDPYYYPYSYGPYYDPYYSPYY